MPEGHALQMPRALLCNWLASQLHCLLSGQGLSSTQNKTGVECWDRNGPERALSTVTPVLPRPGCQPLPLQSFGRAAASHSTLGAQSTREVWGKRRRLLLTWEDILPEETFEAVKGEKMKGAPCCPPRQGRQQQPARIVVLSDCLAGGSGPSQGVALLP